MWGTYKDDLWFMSIGQWLCAWWLECQAGTETGYTLSWDIHYPLHFTIIHYPLHFTKTWIASCNSLSTNTLRILLGTVLLAVKLSDVESTSWCVAINYVRAVTFRCVSCNLLLIIKCRSLWSIYFFSMNQSRSILHSLSISLASEVVSWAEMKGTVLQVSLGELHITWGLS